MWRSYVKTALAGLGCVVLLVLCDVRPAHAQGTASTTRTEINNDADAAADIVIASTFTRDNQGNACNGHDVRSEQHRQRGRNIDRFRPPCRRSTRAATLSGTLSTSTRRYERRPGARCVVTYTQHNRGGLMTARRDHESFNEHSDRARCGRVHLRFAWQPAHEPYDVRLRHDRNDRSND